MAEQRIVSVIGLGYVGLTTVVAFSHTTKVIAFDIDETRITELKQGHDRNHEVSDEELTTKNVYFTNNPADLKKANFHIISVPTPLDASKNPDLSILLSSSQMLGRHLTRGDIVVYESTVYPGVTEDKCIPALESASQLICGKDFAVGYSPERINPADKEHTFQTIVKIVSGTDTQTLDIIANEYGRVVKAGVFPVSSIRIAEATKVIENTQRDVNIAFMNDINLMLHVLGIDAAEVIDAMRTKWNFISFEPGLVGGHCIGVNTYYLLYKAKEMGYHSDLILAARKINESIVDFIVRETIKKLINQNVLIKGSRIGILGLTYKENCADIRDSRVIEMIKELQSYGVEIIVHDPLAEACAVKKEYGIDLVSWEALTHLDAVILTVAHQQYKDLSERDFSAKLRPRGLIVDTKKILDKAHFSESELTIWRL